MDFDQRKIRAQFPMLAQTVHGYPFVYLDTAATAQKPASVIGAICRFYEEEYATVHRAVYYFAVHATTRYDQVRENVRAFLGAADAEEIVFTRGTTDGVNLVALAYGATFFHEGDEIILGETEHHSNLIPWQILKAKKGVRIVKAPVDEHGTILLDALALLISPRTKLISLAHISNFTGAVQPIKKIVALAHKHEARVLLDAAQSAPRIPLNVQDLGVDFLAFSGHKAYGPTGIGVLYGKKDLLVNMPPLQGGGDMIERVEWERSTFQAPPLRFEAGTPMIAEVIGLGAALDFMQEIGMDRIAAWEEELLHYATKKLQETPRVSILGNARDKGGVISFSVEGCHPLDIGTLLDGKGIAVRTGHHCAQPALKRFGLTSAVRISFGVYTTKEDIDRFYSALVSILDIL